MKQIILNGIQLDELIDKISEVFQAKLDTLSSLQKSAENTKYLSRSEVSRLLKISLPTLHEWTKLNLLQSYKIGNRVLYKNEEVEKALVQTSSIKYKKNRL